MRQVFFLICILSFASYAEAADKLEKITNMDEFNSFMHTYYLYPQPKLLDDAIKFLGASELASNDSAKAPLLMFFSCVFSLYDSSKKGKWQSTINRLEEPTKSLLNTSANSTHKCNSNYRRGTNLLLNNWLGVRY